MEREDKVISLELSKQIYIEHKRLGIVVESEWWWINDANRTDEHWIIWKKKGYEGTPYPAYDTSELGEMLPSYIVSDNQECSLEQYGEDDFSIEYQSDFAIRDGMKSAFCPFTVIEKYEAEARGTMRLWLLQNGYVKGEGK